MLEKNNKNFQAEEVKKENMVIVEKLYLYPANYFYSDIKDKNERRKKWLLSVGANHMLEILYGNGISLLFKLQRKI